MTRVSRLVALLAAIVVLALPSWGLAAPTLTNAEFDESTNIFTLTFSEAVLTGSGDVALSGMYFTDGISQVDISEAEILNTGAQGTDLQLRFRKVGVIDQFGSTFIWGESFAKVIAVETDLDPTRLQFNLPSGAVRGASGGKGAGAMVNVDYVTYSEASYTAPELTSAKYDPNTNMLYLVFNKDMRFDQFGEDHAKTDIVTLQPIPGNRTLDPLLGEDRNGNGVLDTLKAAWPENIVLSDGSGLFAIQNIWDRTAMFNDTLSYLLPVSEAADLERTLNLEGSVTLSFPAHSFVDANYNGTYAVEDAPVTVEASTDVPEPSSATYNAATNQLTVGFNKTLNTDAATINPRAFGVAYVDGSSLVNVSLTGGYAAVQGGTNVVITLNAESQALVEPFIDANSSQSFLVNILANAVQTPAGNTNLPATQSLTVTNTGTIGEIALTGTPTYDASTNTLVVGFDGEVSALPTDLDPTRFGIIAGTDTIMFTDGTSAVRNANKTSVSVVLNGADAHAYESDAQKQSANVYLEDFAVLADGTRNGNLAQVSSNTINYSPDNTSAPKLVSLWYDEGNGRFKIESTLPLAPSSVDLTKLTFEGTTLSAADSVVVADDSYSVYAYVNTANAATLAGKSGVQKVDPEVTFTQGFITSDDDVSAAAQSTAFQDGDSVDGMTVFVGHGREFQVRTFLVFNPPAPPVVEASFRRGTSHGDFYVDNALWRNGVDFDETLDARRFYQDTVYTELVSDLYAPIGRPSSVPARVDFLFTDVVDEFNSANANDADQHLYQPGYFEMANTGLNGMDLIVLDAAQQDFTPGSWGQSAMANVFTGYVLRKVDPFEKDWVVRGLQYYTEWYLTGRMPEFYHDPTVDTGEGAASSTGGVPTEVPVLDNLTVLLNSTLYDRTPLKHLFLFFLYLDEQYGSATVGDIGQDLNTGVVGMNNHLSVTFHQAYLNFATAGLLDATNVGGTETAYQFENIDLSPTIESLDWPSTTTVYDENSIFTSVGYGMSYLMTSITDTLDGVTDPTTATMRWFMPQDVASTMMVRKVNLRSVDSLGNAAVEYLVEDFSPNADGTMMLDMNTDNSSWVFTYDDANTNQFDSFILIPYNGGDFKLTLDNTGADYLNMFVSQNPYFARHMDIDVIASEVVYNNRRQPVPIIYGTSDAAATDTLITFDTADNISTTSGGNGTNEYYLYEATAYLQLTGNVYWNLGGFYENGVEVSLTDQPMVSIMKVTAGEAAHLALGEDFSLYTSGRTFGSDQVVTMARNSVNAVASVDKDKATVAAPNMLSVSPVYSVNAGSNELLDPVSVTLRYDVDAAGGKQAGLYLYDNGAWQYVGGSVNEDEGTISARIPKLGDLRVLAGQHGQVADGLAIPQEYSLKQNYPNPFNPTTTVAFEMPNAGRVSLTVYDVLGRQVANLVDGDMGFGVHRVVWNGRSDAGIPMSSGVYFVRMNAAGFQDVKKMILVK